jgi:hypothetical protein
MKTLLSIFALTLALAFIGPAFTSPAFAGDAKDAKTESDCMMAGGTWDDTTKTCAKNKM